MSVTDDFSRYFREAGVEPAAVQPAHVSADNLSWVRQMSTQSYRDTKVQVSGILSPENEPSNVTRLGVPDGAGGVPTDSSLWPQTTLDQRRGKFIFRTLVERNFNTQEIAILLIEAYYSKAQVNALLIGKRAVWRVVLMPLTQSGNWIVDSEMVNALHNIMSEVKHVVPTTENISKALRCTGYVQHIGFDSNDVPTPYLPRIATASGVAMAMGMLAGMFKYRRQKDGTTFVDAESTQSAAFEEVTDERLRVPSSLRWDTVKQNLPQTSTPQQMQLVPFDGMDHAVYQTNLGSTEQHRPVLSFIKDAWENIANMIRVSHVTGLLGGGVEQGDLVWLGFHAKEDYVLDLKIPKFRIIKAEDAAQIENLSGGTLAIGALHDSLVFKVGTLFDRGVPAQISPHDFVVVTPKQIDPHTVPRLEYVNQGDFRADGDYTNSLVMSVPEFFGADLSATVSADDIVAIDTGLDEIDDEDEPEVPEDDGGGDVRLIKAADAYKYLAEEGRGGLLLQSPVSGFIEQDDVLALNGMPLFKAPDGAVMAALPTSPGAEYLDAVEIHRPTKNKIMRFKRFVGTKYADRAAEVVQYTPSPGQNADISDIVYELPSIDQSPAAWHQHSGALQLVRATDAPSLGMFERSTQFMLVDRAAGGDLAINGVRIFGAPDGKVMVRLDSGFVAITPPPGGQVEEGDFLTVNGMALFEAPDGRLMAALPSLPEAPTFDAVEVHHRAEGGFTEPVVLSNDGYAAPTFKPVQYTGGPVPNLAKFERLADTGEETIIWQEIPYTAPAVDGDAGGMRELIAAVDSETTEDTYNATSTQLSALSGWTQRLTADTAAAVQSVMKFVGGPDATYDTFTQPESLQRIMHDISPIAWAVSSFRRAIAPPPSEADIAGAADWIESFSQSRDSVGMLESMIEESMGTKHHEIAGLVTKPQNTNAVAVLGRLDLPAMVSTQAQMLDERLRATLSRGLPREQNSREEIVQLVAREVKQSAAVIKYTIMSEKSVLLVERWRENFESGNGVAVQEMEEIVHRDLLDNMDYYREEFQLEPLTEQVLVMAKDVTAAFVRGAADGVAALPGQVADFCHRTDAALDITVTVSGWYAKGLDGVVNLWESAASSSQALAADVSDYAHYAWQNPGQALTYKALPPRERRALLAYLKVVHKMAIGKQHMLDAGSSAWQQKGKILADGYDALPPRGKNLVLGYLKTVHSMAVKAEWASEGAATVWRDLKSLHSVGIFPEPDQVLRLMQDLGPKGLMDAHNEAMKKPTGAPPDAGVIRDCLVSLGLESGYDKHVGPVVSTVISYVPPHPRWEEQRIASQNFKTLYYDIWDVFKHPTVVGMFLEHTSDVSLDAAVALLVKASRLSPLMETSNYASKYDYGLALLQDVTSPTFDGLPSPPPMGPHLPHNYVQRPFPPAEVRPGVTPYVATMNQDPAAMGPHLPY